MDCDNIDDVTTASSSSFKYESGLLKGLTSRAVNDGNNPNIPQAHRLFTKARILVPISYVSLFSRYLELTWNKNCIMSSVVGPATFQIKSTKLYVPAVTLKAKDNVTLIEHLEKGFKRSVCWNEYKLKIESQEADNNNFKRFLLDAN